MRRAIAMRLGGGVLLLAVLLPGTTVAQDDFGLDGISMTSETEPDKSGSKADDFGGLEAMALKEIDALIAEASDAGEFPDGLGGLARLEGREGQFTGSLSGKATLSVKLSRGRFVVVTITQELFPNHPTVDVIASDPDNDAFLRVRRGSDGSLIRLRGIGSKSAPGIAGKDPLRRSQIAWSGKVEDPRSILNGCKLQMLEEVSYVQKWRLRATKDGKVVHDEMFLTRFLPTDLDEELKSLTEPVPKPKPSGLAGLLADLFGGGDKKDPAKKAAEGEHEDYRFEELNFRFVHPGGRYVKTNAAALNPEASLALMRAVPPCFMIVIAEEVGVDGQMSADDLVTISQSVLQSAADKVEFGETEERKYNGLNFRRYATLASTSNRSFNYCHHLAVHNGYVYQIVAWTTSATGKAAFLKEADRLMEGFHLIDPDRKSALAGTPAPAYEAPQFGIRVEESPAGGQLYDTLAADYPQARHGVYFPKLTGSMIVVPVRVGELDLDDDALAHGLMSTAGVSYPDQTRHAGEVTQGTAAGIEYTAEADAEGNRFRYLLRLLRNGDSACLLAAWETGEKDLEESRKKLAGMLDIVQFSAPVAGGDDQATPAESSARAVILNDAALAVFNRGDYDTAGEVFHAAFEADPQNLTVVGNTVEAFERQGRYGDALEFLRQSPQLLKSNRSLQAREASLLADSGRGEEAVEKYAGLFDGGYRNEDDLLAYLTALVGLSRAGDAQTAVETFMKKGRPSLRVRRWHAQVLTETGDTAAALAVWRTLAEENPRNADLRDDLVEALLSDGQPDEALGLIAQLEKDGGSAPARIAYLRGEAYFQQQEYRKAKESYEAAAKDAPGDERIEQGLRLASAALGQGDNSLIKTPVDPVAIPEELRAALAGVPSDKLPGGYNTELVQSVTGFYFEKGKPIRRSEHRRIRIVNQAGVRESGTLQFTFDPVYEQIFLNRLEVFDPDGKKVSEGKASDYYVSAANAGDLATQDRTLYAPVPGLKAGYVIEYTLTTADMAPSDTFGFERLLFVSGSPCTARAVFVAGDPGAVSFVSRNATFREVRGDGFAAWMLESPPLFQWEGMLPKLDHYLPLLVLGDTFGDWETVARDYLKKIADRLSPSKETRELALSVVGDKKSPEEKADAILRWVQDEIAYQGIEFGSRAQIPNRTPKILADRYGDCKDHSLLAREMFEAVGIPCHLALVDSGSALHASLPSLDQFDHMILYAPSLGGGRFFDCTAKSQGFHLAAPPNLAAQTSLVLDPENPRLIAIPGYSEEENVLRSERTLRLDGDAGGDLRIAETFSASGYYGGWLRAYFQDSNAADHLANLQQVLGNLGKIHLESVRLENADAVSEPFVIRMEYRIRKALRADGSIELPAVWEDYYLKPHYAQERKSPFAVDVPMRLESVVRFDPASAWLPADAEKIDAGESADWFTWKLTQPGSDSEWTRQWNFRQSTGVFPSDQFQSYQHALESALDAFRAKLELR